MIQQTINPYVSVAIQFRDGLISIIDEIYAAPSVDNLTEAIVEYIDILGYYPTPLSYGDNLEIRSVIGNSINSFTNNRCKTLYGGTQLRFVNAMTGSGFIIADTVDTIGSRLEDINNEIPKCGLSVDQQTPLFLASIFGIVANEYFIESINAGDTNWQAFFDDALTSPVANLPFWVQAGMNGALIGARLSPRGLIAPTTNIVTTEIVSALIAALAITVGKVVFKWTPRIKDIGPATPMVGLDLGAIPGGEANKEVCVPKTGWTLNSNGCSNWGITSDCMVWHCNGHTVWDQNGRPDYCDCWWASVI